MRLSVELLGKVRITTYKADYVSCGTLNALKELEKLGLFTIVEIQDYTEHEEWCESEGYEVYSESFRILIEDKENPINSHGYDYVTRMICGLVDYVTCEFK